MSDLLIRGIMSGTGSTGGFERVSMVAMSLVNTNHLGLLSVKHQNCRL